ncbi:MAG: helix-turn-helix domain-containing protein [Candidatus Geothermarchaeales archaeon]
MILKDDNHWGDLALEDVEEEAVLRALADDYSRQIIVATIQEALSVAELSRKHGIPVATAYRRISRLVEDRLVAKERARLSEEGKWFDLFRSTVREIEVHLDSQGINVATSLNEDMVNRLTRLWGDLRGAREAGWLR